MPAAKIAFQVGAWVTLSPAGRRGPAKNRERRDARTPALITAISIENGASGVATLLYPNPLTLMCGFQGQGWRRLTDVPLANLREYNGAGDKKLQEALLMALRSAKPSESLRGLISMPPPAVPRPAQEQQQQQQPQKRPVLALLAEAKTEAQAEVKTEPVVKSEDASDMEDPGMTEQDSKRRRLENAPSSGCAAEELPATGAETTAADAVTCDATEQEAAVEPQTQDAAANPLPEGNFADLRQWMRPGSVWNKEDAEAGDASADVPIAGADDNQDSKEGDDEAADVAEDAAAAPDASSSPAAVVATASELKAKAALQAAPASPLPPAPGSPATPSPVRCAAGAKLPPLSPAASPRKLWLESGHLTKAVARAFQSAGKHYVSRTELFERVHSSLGGDAASEKAEELQTARSAFEVHLRKLDKLNKVLIVDELVFLVD